MLIFCMILSTVISIAYIRLVLKNPVRDQEIERFVRTRDYATKYNPECKEKIMALAGYGTMAEENPQPKKKQKIDKPQIQQQPAPPQIYFITQEEATQQLGYEAMKNVTPPKNNVPKNNRPTSLPGSEYQRQETNNHGY